MSNTTQCIFCKIIDGKEEASIVYEDEMFMVLMDAYPLTEGHVLIIPKTHCVRLHEMQATQQAALFELADRVMKAQRACGLGTEGCNLLLNDGKAANQTIAHLHLHLIPRVPHDFLKALPKLVLHLTGNFGFRRNRKKLDDLAQRIENEL
jgi:histidine triad (HIT) family protein